MRLMGVPPALAVDPDDRAGLVPDAPQALGKRAVTSATILACVVLKWHTRPVVRGLSAAKARRSSSALVRAQQLERALLLGDGLRVAALARLELEARALDGPQPACRTRRSTRAPDATAGERRR